LELDLPTLPAPREAPRPNVPTASDWADIEAWCRAAGLARAAAALTTVGAYLTDRAGHLKVATLARRIAAGRNVLDRVTPIFSILPP
jgi:hypothetical protein